MKWRSSCSWNWSCPSWECHFSHGLNGPYICSWSNRLNKSLASFVANFLAFFPFSFCQFFCFLFYRCWHPLFFVWRVSQVLRAFAVRVCGNCFLIRRRVGREVLRGWGKLWETENAFCVRKSTRCWTAPACPQSWHLICCAFVLWNATLRFDSDGLEANLLAWPPNKKVPHRLGSVFDCYLGEQVLV